MMPNTSLTVDGSERTLICVDAIPSTGAVVGEGGGGSGVCEGGGVRVGGRVAVIIVNAGVAVPISRTCIPQPVQNKANRIIIEKYL